MNSEELEQSLRTEFENYLKNTIAEMKQEVSEFQQTIESEFEKHKSHIDESFKSFSEKFGDAELKESFRETVSEHLKLARDDGSKITVAAFEEAEKLKDEEEVATPVATHFGDVRDAINDISSKDSQSEILKSLVSHATQFTPRGAFFIVKNEHLVGWRMFGTEGHPNPEVVREVFFPLSSNTALSGAVDALGTVGGINEDGEDGLLYLNKLEFEQPENTYAIPLMARGRGVAVLYADNGTEGGSVNVEALETLMRVAGLTVEVLASTQIAKSQVAEKSAYAPVEEAEEREAPQEEEQQVAEEYSQPEVEAVEEAAPTEFAQTDISSDYEAVEEVQPVEEAEMKSDYSFEPEEAVETDEEDNAKSFDFQPVAEVPKAVVDEVEETVSYDDSWVQPSEDVAEESSSFDTVEEDTPVAYDSFESSVDDSAPAFEDHQDDINKTFEPATKNESIGFDTFSDLGIAGEQPQKIVENHEVEVEPSYEFETSNETNFDTVADTAEEVKETVEVAGEPEVAEETVAAPPIRKRFAERNVDLPIEVTEDERRLHNDARRFARLLVSEIKLYNEQKVKEGRESSDLYERLREAIDRSREMYDKRVQPPVAAKFDYFNYEIVNTLAEGDEGKLGGSYPGAVV